MSAEAAAELVETDRSQGLTDLRDALDLAAHVVAGDPLQLGSQLLGRLDATRSAAVGRVLAAARTQRSRPWFLPLTPSLVGVGGPLRMTLTAHIGWVGAVALARDGRVAVSAGDDGLIKVWRLDDGTCLHTLAGHRGPVRAAAVDADGAVIASAGDDGTVRFWDVDGETETARFQNPGVVRSVAVAADGSVAVWAGDDGHLWCWRRRGDEPPAAMPGHRERIRGVAISGDGSIAASVGDDGNVLIWNTATADVITSAVAYGGWSVSLDERGRRVAWGRKDHRLVTWDRERGDPEEKRGHGGLVRAVALTAGAGSIVTGSDDRSVRLWTNGGVNSLVLGEHASAVGAVAVASSGHVAVSGSGDGAVMVWDLGAARRPAPTVPVMHHSHEFGVEGLLVRPDGGAAVSRAGDGSLKSWDLISWTTVREYRDEQTMSAGPLGVLAGLPGGIVDLAFHAGKQTRVLRIWDEATGTLHQLLDAGEMRLNALAASASGDLVIAGRHDGKLAIFDLARGTRTTVGPGHRSAILDVAITADDRGALTASSDGTVGVWDTADWDRRPRILGSSGPGVTAVAEMPTPGYVVAGSLDGVVTVWDVHNAEPAVRSQLHRAAVNDLTVVPWGATVVSASADRTVRAWWPRHPDRASPTFTGQTAMQCLAATPGGTVLAGEKSGRIHALQLVEAVG